MKDKNLFLLGGYPNLFETNKEFVRLAGGRNSRIALLFANSPGWQEYLHLYTDIWHKIGIGCYTLVLPDENQKIDDSQIQVIQNATGIFIGGGVPELYYKAYVENEKIREEIKGKYGKGTPVAACSAGALILPKETYLLGMDDKIIRPVEGMGLIDKAVIGVHYTEFNQEENVEEMKIHYSIANAYGIDEDSCAIFKNKNYIGYHGKPVHVIK